MTQLFNDRWEFSKAPTDTVIEDVPSLSFSPVDIPHDWLIADSDKLYETSCGVYRRSLAYGGGRTRLYFEGVYMDCTLYVNGTPAGENKYGYSSFEIDITDLLHEGENELVMLVRHNSPNSRWYSGAGIFRNIRLITTPADCLATDGVYFHAEKHGAAWHCTVSAEVIGSGEVTYTLGKSDAALLYSGEDGEFDITDSPDIVWDIDNPCLLTLTASLRKNGDEIDHITQRVGLRTAEFSPDKGFLLNGRQVKLHGVCLHHDLGALGAAVNREATRQQLLSMQRMGANAVRTSHNMPSVEFMELCDEMGILVDSEAFDMWERPKTEFDYARFFDEWYERDVASWVRRDRNHPSVIMWSVGNEIYDTHVSPRGREVAKMLHAAVRKHDPLKNAFTTIGSNYMPWEPAQLCADEVDLAGYNYGEPLYNEHHEKYPDWCIYGSETTAGGKSRGVYHFPLSAVFLTHDDMQCSSLGNCRAGAGAATAGQVIAADRDTDFCAGMFIWTGSDYIGEPTPYSTKNSYYGSIDTAGLRKDSYYLYQSAWTDRPVLHFFPYWDFNPGQLIDVCAYTNAYSAELFVNGNSVGVKKAEEYTVSWQVPYEEGAISVTARDENGDPVFADGEPLEASEQSFGNTARLQLVRNKELKADGQDLVRIVIFARDSKGRTVRNARDRVSLSVEGARLIGFDNGDSTDYDSYKSSCRKLFGGMAVALVAAPDKPGTVTVRAEAPGIPAAEISFEAQPAEVTKGISCKESIPASPISDEVPVRKIALTRDSGAVITPDRPEVKITAEIFPKNATYANIKWSVVTNSGILSDLAIISECEGGVILSAVGDGEFRLRCSCFNGKPFPEVISDYEFRAEGFGQPFTDPYKFVTGCFFRDSAGVMDEVSEGGISVTKEKNTVGYTKIDFGEYGCTGFFVRMIHWHTNEPVSFRLYDGKPSDGGRLIGEYTYQADFIWQTYQDNTYELSEPLCGIHDIYFEFGHHEQRLYFGGFGFIPRQKAYEKISAAKADLIHGDSFERSGDRVVGIGNNVVLEFSDMDFSRGISALRLFGRTRHDNDSVHVHIVSEDGTAFREIVEFPGSADYSVTEIPFRSFRGKASVQFQFLPGCDFDFDSFMFIPE